MLSDRDRDRDRDRLREIQRDLSAEDPGFVRSFETASPPPAADRDESPYTRTVWICVLALIMVLISLTLRSTTSAVVFAAVALLAAVREFRDTNDEQKR